MSIIPNNKTANAVSITSSKSKGSGVFIQYKGVLYLVTAKHVLYLELNGEYKLLDNKITLKCPSHVKNDYINRIMEIDLNDQNVWYNHNNDIAAVEIGQSSRNEKEKRWDVRYHKNVHQLEKGAYSPQLNSENTFKFLNDVKVATDVIVFGFPTSLGITNYLDFFDVDKPILRKGSVAYLNYKRSHIIIDCPVYPGNSGGPVFEVIVNESGNQEVKLIGIVSRYIPFKQEWVNYRDNLVNAEFVNSGYTVVMSTDLIIQTIELIPSRSSSFSTR